MLVPVIGLVQVGVQAMADRYTYLPQIGLCIALAWGAARLVASRPYRRRVCGAGSTLVLAVLMACALAADDLLVQQRSAMGPRHAPRKIVWPTTRFGFRAGQQ